jgi:hypothetical protein
MSAYRGVITVVTLPFAPMIVLVPFPLFVMMPCTPRADSVVCIRPMFPVTATDPRGVNTRCPIPGEVAKLDVADVPDWIPDAKALPADRLRIAAAIGRIFFMIILQC